MSTCNNCRRFTLISVATGECVIDDPKALVSQGYSENHGKLSRFRNIEHAACSAFEPRVSPLAQSVAPTPDLKGLAARESQSFTPAAALIDDSLEGGP